MDIVTVLATLIFSVVTIGVFIAMGYYAVKNLRGFKGGLLSKGWRYISVAVFFFIAGQFFLDSGAGQATRGLEVIARYNILLGSIMETAGGLLLVLGFRAQNNIWRMGKVAETNAVTSASPPSALSASSAKNDK